MHYQHFLGLGVRDLEVGNAYSDATFVAILAKQRKAEDLWESTKYSWVEFEFEVAVAVAAAVAARSALVAM